MLDNTGLIMFSAVGLIFTLILAGLGLGYIDNKFDTEIEESNMGSVVFSNTNSSYIEHTLTGVPDWVSACFNVTVAFACLEKNTTHFRVITESKVNASCNWRAVKSP
jgi:hypothetical protein